MSPDHSKQQGFALLSVFKVPHLTFVSLIMQIQTESRIERRFIASILHGRCMLLCTDTGCVFDDVVIEFWRRGL